MKNEFVKRGMIALVLLVFLAIVAVYFTDGKMFARHNGERLFANAYDKVLEVETIHVTTPKDQITLYLEEDVWKVKEAGGYYANYYILLEDLFPFMENTYYEYKSEEGILDEEDKVSLKIATKDNRVIDEVTIAGTKVQAVGQDEVYVLDSASKFVVPFDLYSWVVQPLMQIDHKELEKFETVSEKGHVVVSRIDVSAPFQHEGKNVEMGKVLGAIAYLVFDAVVPEKDFNEDEFKEHKQFKFTTFDGLVVSLDIYHNGKEYWVRQELSTTKMPRSSVKSYVEYNKFLYEGWFFRLNADIAKNIFEYRV